MKYIKKIITLIILITLITGCSFNIESNNMKDINIYTTTYPINYLITSLYGDYSKTYSIYPNGIDLNTYKISKRKLTEYSKSDLFIFNSLDKDRKYAVKMINANSKLKVIDVATGMNYDYSVEELWLNPYNYLMMAENIKKGLNEYINNPYLISEIEKNYDTLDYNISKIDSDLTESIKNATYKTIVVDNNIFKFLEKYGLKVISLEDNEKTSTTTLNEVNKLITEKKIKYIYSTTESGNTLTQKLVKNTGIKVIKINTMYSVDGGITNTNDNYLSIMKNNINLIENELYK